MHQCVNTNAWVQQTFDMTPFAGQTVALKFLVHQDGFGDDTSMSRAPSPCDPTTPQYGSNSLGRSGFWLRPGGLTKREINWCSARPGTHWISAQGAITVRIWCPFRSNRKPPLQSHPREADPNCSNGSYFSVISRINLLPTISRSSARFVAASRCWSSPPMIF